MEATILEEITKLVREFASDPNDTSRVCRYVNELIDLRGQLRHAEANNAQLARHRRTDDIEPKTLALVESLRETITRQDEEIQNLKRELTKACRGNHEKNVALDAMHWVWCDGGCYGGTHRFVGDPEKLTAAVVKEAIRNTERLQRRYSTLNYRLKRDG